MHRLFDAVSYPIYLLSRKDETTKDVPRPKVKGTDAFRFDDIHPGEPSNFEIYFRTKGQEFRYTLSFDAEGITSESLAKKDVGDEGDFENRRVWVRHVVNGKPYELRLGKESAGTRKMMSMAVAFDDALKEEEACSSMTSRLPSCTRSCSGSSSCSSRIPASTRTVRSSYSPPRMSAS